MQVAPPAVDDADKSKRHLNVSTMATTSADHELTNQTKHWIGVQERIAASGVY